MKNQMIVNVIIDVLDNMYTQIKNSTNYIQTALNYITIQTKEAQKKSFNVAF